MGPLTPAKSNMAPENRPLEKEFLLETIIFGFHVSFPGCISKNPGWWNIIPFGHDCIIQGDCFAQRIEYLNKQKHGNSN